MLKKLAQKLQYLTETILHYQNWWSVLTLRPPRHLAQLRLRSGWIFQGHLTTQLAIITDEIFFHQVYSYKQVKVEPGDVVIDIGANVGIFDVFAASQGASQVLAYEPFPKNVSLIRQNLKLNHLKNVKVIQTAVSGRVGQAQLFVGEVDSGNLLFDHNINGPLKKHLSVPTTTLAEIFKTQNLSLVDFLKIDCEGSEGTIFKTTSTVIWRKVRKIALEFHDNVSSLSHRQIIQKLHQLGFKTYLKYDGSSPFGYIYGWKKSGGKLKKSP